MNRGVPWGAIAIGIGSQSGSNNRKNEAEAGESSLRGGMGEVEGGVGLYTDLGWIEGGAISGFGGGEGGIG